MLIGMRLAGFKIKTRNDKFKGFTLAEILITLGIIGVVAAITIPSLVAKYQKKITVIQLKNTFSTLQQAVKMSSEDNGDCEDWDYTLSKSEFIERYFLPYLKASKVDMTITFTDLKGGSHTFGNSYPKFMLLDGSVIIYVQHNFQVSNHLVVDLNGLAKPNKVGRDVFVLSFWGNTLSTYTQYSDLKMKHNDLIYRGGTSGQCSKYAAGGILGPGSYCSRLIQTDGWNISNDYPW